MFFLYFRWPAPRAPVRGGGPSKKNTKNFIFLYFMKNLSESQLVTLSNFRERLFLSLVSKIMIFRPLITSEKVQFLQRKYIFQKLITNFENSPTSNRYISKLRWSYKTNLGIFSSRMFSSFDLAQG